MAEENARAYRQVVRYLCESPWAIHKPMLGVMREIVELRLSGVRLEDAEIEQRISGGRKRPDATSGPSVAVVPLWGVLVPHAGMMADVSQPGTGLDEWLQNFQDAVNDPNVQSILLYVDSPGGSADLVSEVAAEVRAARAKKDIIGVASTMAASAAYAIFAQATTCIVTPSGQVGSIGVYTIHEDISAMLEAQGVKPTVIQAPADGYKTERQPFGPLSEDATAHLQRMVDSYYQLFVQDVAKGRGVDANTVMADYGKGRVYTAKDALAAGMVDGIASFEQVLARMVAGQPPLGGRSQQAALDEPEPVAALPAPAVAVDSVLRLDGTALGTAVAEQLAKPHMAVIDGQLLMIDPPPVAAAEPPETELVPVAGPVGPTGHEGAVGPTGGPDTEDRLAGEEVPAAATTEVPAPASSTTSTDTSTTERSTQMEPDSTTGRPPTLEELAAHRDGIKSEMDELDAKYAGQLMDADAKGRFDELDEQHQLVEATIKQINDRRSTLAARAGEQERTVPGTAVATAPHTAAGRRGPDNIYDLAAYRQHARSMEDLAGLWKDGARRANETLAYEVEDPERVRAFVERLLAKEKGDKADPSESFAHRILLTANPLYDAAFGKMVMNRPLTTSEEQMVRMAVSNTGLGAETPVPVTIDPSVLLTSDGQANPLRRIARVISITGNKWRGISSDGVSVVYDAELAQVADQTPTFDSPEAEVQKAHGWVEFSIEVDQDWGSFRTELATMFQDAKDAKEAEKFLFGTGVNEPEGLIAALVAEGSSIIPTDAVNTFALPDLELVVDALPPRFDANARWLANKGIFAQVRALAGAEGRIDVWVPLAQGFANAPSGATGYTLLGYPVDVASEMSKASTTGGEEIAVLGDFGRGFIIVDRIGLNVEIVPLVAGTGGRPRGTRGMYVYFRNTSQLRTPNAFRVLQVQHT